MTRTRNAFRALIAVTALAVPVAALAEEHSEPVPGIDPETPLSEQLREDKSVIEPPPVGDSGIHVPAPDPDPGTTPVIPPEDLPDATPQVAPK